ncbi:hypothetical protein J6G99_03155 [bacterium]|nr:hypothetical protein [bacterium]
MGIETSSSVNIASSSGANLVASQNLTSVNQRSNNSFKNEMNKVAETEKKDNEKLDEKKTSDSSLKNEMNKVAETEKKDNEKLNEKKTSGSSTEEKSKKHDSHVSSTDVLSPLNSQMALSDANNILQNGIAEMMNSASPVDSIDTKDWSFGIGSNTLKSNLKMTESDANFFLSLTQNDNVTAQNIVTQAQTMINNGADVKETSQNVHISQTLLNALSEARQNNQPLRIDFDQNISVIIRVGKDGAISANFIPGDKAVEQYLRSNIESLRNTFDEQNIDYAELSYSNSSKKQNKQRREQQGE